MDQKMFKLFRENKTMISTIKDPKMIFRRLKDHDIITKQRYEKLEPNEEGVYTVLDYIENGGLDCVKKIWNCIKEKHILERYCQLSELNNIVQSFQDQKEGSKKQEKVGEVKKMESSSMGRDGPSSHKRKPAEHDGRGYQSPHLGNNKESVLRPKEKDDGKTREVKRMRTEGSSSSLQAEPSSLNYRGYQSPHLGNSSKIIQRPKEKDDGKAREVKKRTESSSSSLQAGPSSLNPKNPRKTSEHENREVKRDLWDMPKNKRWLPVTCGKEKALLDRYLLNQRKRDCIERRGKMISPFDFEKLSMRGQHKSWKTSITCQGITLKTLMEMGKLKVPHYNGKFTLRK